MIKCKICGHENKYRLIEHINKTHNISIAEYKENYGDVVSEEYKKIVSNKFKEKWKEADYREKTILSRKWIYTDEVLQKRRIESIKKYYDDGGKTWNDGLTKDEDERVKHIGELNRLKLLGRTKDNFEYLRIHSLLMKDKWSNSNLKKRQDEIQESEVLKTEWKTKISETLTNRIINGEINTKSNYKHGWYENKNGKHWYSSNLEKDAMILFDNYDIQWENNKLKIKYKDKDNRDRYYIPDFSLNINNKQIIIEMKGYDWDGLTDIKSEYAKLKYEYYIFYNIEDLKKYLNKDENNNY
jgi:hypothetical protein